MSEVTWIVDRVKLYEMYYHRQITSPPELSQRLGRSRQWVSKWLKRFDERKEDATGLTLFASESRARQTSYKRVTEEVEAAILQIRDEPPAELGRVPGPKAILFYLHQDEALKAAGVYLPRGVRTIWQILDQHQRIYRPPQRVSQPVMESLVDLFVKEGLPQTIRFDRDPRFIGSWSSNEFPSAMMRLLRGLGIVPIVCPAHRPDKNPYVERYNGTYKRECLRRHQPSSLAQTIDVTQLFQHQYNYRRPNQAVTCQNQPPRVAFPDAKTNRSLPIQVDPDAWLRPASQRVYKRRVNASGSIQLGRHRYYVGTAFRKRQVLIRLLPQDKQLAFFDDNTQLIKKQPIKGLYGSPMMLEEFIDVIHLACGRLSPIPKLVFELFSTLTGCEMRPKSTMMVGFGSIPRMWSPSLDQCQRS